MLVFKQLFNLFFILHLFAIFAYASEKMIYSYEQKMNVSFLKALKSSNIFLLVDENCSVCEQLLKDKHIREHKKLAFALINEPSFSWIAKIKRQNLKKMIFNIKNLRIDDTHRTPQILKFDLKGNKKLQIYGRSKIIKFFESMP